MKRSISLFLILVLLLSGCGNVANDRRVLVSIEEMEGCTIENNGQYILPGEDAVFTLTLDPGLSLVGADYPGVQFDTKRGVTTLTIPQVRYPTRIRLEVSHDYAQITYHANGGYALHSLDTSITKSYSLSLRSRPNTDTGTDLFAREGHTLVCWNTESDGSGTRIGLGSRITVSDGEATLYAQWAKWCEESSFSYVETENGISLTDYHGNGDPLVIPEVINGLEVTAIEAGAFVNCTARSLILPKSMDHIAPSAFQNCAYEILVLYDNIQTISDDSFVDCRKLKTLYINAIEDPYGYAYRKESHYADKVDLLIAAQGKEKLVFYGGCSIWYNLDSSLVRQTLGESYEIINMGLNGTVSSAVQLQIMGAFLKSGDILFHTPEISSRHQLMTEPNMRDTDKIIWAGLENNYDLFSLVDLTTIGGVLDSFCAYLNQKNGQTNYQSYFTDDNGLSYLGNFGCIPFGRTVTQEDLADKVYLDPGRIDAGSMAALESYYQWYQRKGVRIYVSHACVNLDAVDESQQNNLQAVEDAFRNAIAAMEGPVLLGDMEDFVYHNEDFYDTNYHLLSAPAKANTELWLTLLVEQLTLDGLWKGASQ